VVVHLGIQCPLGQRLLQLVKQTIRVECRFGVAARQ
jgi:hypothetical protein